MNKVRTIIAILFMFIVVSLSVVTTFIEPLEAQETDRETQLESLKKQISDLKSGSQNRTTISRIATLQAKIDELEDTGCLSCALVIRYTSLTDQYVEKLSDKVKPGMIMMFASLVGLWIVLQGYKLLLGVIQPQQLYMDFIYIAIASILLNRVGTNLVNDVYHASLSVMAGASSIAFILAEKVDLRLFHGTPGVEEYKDLIQLVYTVEHAVRKVINVASQLITSAGGNPVLIIKNLFFALILVVPYFLVMSMFFAQLVISIFRLMMLAAFSPFLMMAYAFGWGRGMAESAIKTLISSIATLFAVTTAVAVVVYAVDQADAILNFETTKNMSLSNVELITLVIMGIMGTAFMTEATNIANSITGSALGNLGAGIVTAGTAAIGAGTLAQRHRMNPLSWGRSYTGMKGSMGSGAEGLGQVRKDAGSLYQRVKDVSRGIVKA